MVVVVVRGCVPGPGKALPPKLVLEKLGVPTLKITAITRGRVPGLERGRAGRGGEGEGEREERREIHKRKTKKREM